MCMNTTEKLGALKFEYQIRNMGAGFFCLFLCCQFQFFYLGLSSFWVYIQIIIHGNGPFKWHWPTMEIKFGGLSMRSFAWVFFYIFGVIAIAHRCRKNGIVVCSRDCVEFSQSTRQYPENFPKNWLPWLELINHFIESCGIWEMLSGVTETIPDSG